MTSLDGREFGLQESLCFLESPVSLIFCLIIFLLPEDAQRFSKSEGFTDFRGMQRKKERGASGAGW